MQTATAACFLFSLFPSPPSAVVVLRSAASSSAFGLRRSGFRVAAAFPARRDYCNDFRGKFGRAARGLSLGEGGGEGWGGGGRGAPLRRGSFSGQTSAQGAACPDLIPDIFGGSVGKLMKEKYGANSSLNCGGLAVRTRPQACEGRGRGRRARTHTHTHVRVRQIHIQTHTLQDMCNLSLL